MDWRDRYELIGKIGSGGSADVYEAVDHKRDRHVALKIVPLGRGTPARVLREVEAAAALAHPNVVALYDWFGDGEHNYIVSELVQGERLDELSLRLHDADVVALGAELLDAVAAAHAQGVVHRDIKPQNVMLDTEGHVKVMDFGIALLLDAETLTQDGDVIGTVAYMSPEQAGGRRVGPPSDVYSAGMVLYELLAGEHPLRGETSAQTLANVSAARLPSLAELRPDLSDDLIELIDAACAERPSERPSAAGLADALYDLLESGEVRGRRWRRLRAWTRPVASLGPAVERVAGAGLAAATGVVTLNALPAYPGGWTLPLVSVATALWAVVPQVGLAWLLGMLAFPLFNVSASIGVIYLVGAVAVFWIARARPIVAVWPALALLLAPLALTLVVPAAACLIGRVRGPLTAAWAAVVTFVYLTVAGTPGLFTMFQDATGLAGELVAAGNPFAAAVALTELVTQPACLLQAGLWAAVALALGLARAVPGLEARLWLWSVVFAALVSVYAVVPAVVWGTAVTPAVLALNVAAAAVVVLLPLLWLSGVEPQVVPDEPLQGD